MGRIVPETQMVFLLSNIFNSFFVSQTSNHFKWFCSSSHFLRVRFFSKANFCRPRNNISLESGYQKTWSTHWTILGEAREHELTHRVCFIRKEGLAAEISKERMWVCHPRSKHLLDIHRWREASKNKYRHRIAKRWKLARLNINGWSPSTFFSYTEVFADVTREANWKQKVSFRCHFEETCEEQSN